MSLSEPRAIYGVHSVTPYNRSNGKFYGTLRVLDGSSISLSGETNDLIGGSSRYPWASEDGKIEAEMSLKTKEYPNFLFELFLGKAPTDNSAEANGNVSTLTNKYGTSTQNTTTGIASVSALAGSEANLKFGKYVVEVISATTVKVYLSTDADIARGTNGEFLTDGLAVTAALTITSGADTNVTAFGFKFTGGSGAIAMTIGDTATFEVRPANSKSMDVKIGSTSDTIFPEFGAIVMAQKRSNQEMVEIDAYRCKGIGLPIGFEMANWSSAEIKAKMLYDSSQDAVFKVRHVSPTGS